MLGHRLRYRPPRRRPQRRVVAERPGRRQVELLSFAREQVAVHRLPGQRVAKDVPLPRPIGHEEVLVGQLPGRRQQYLVVEAAGGRQQPV